MDVTSYLDDSGGEILNRYDSLDGIRGIAAIYVMYFHISMFFLEDLDDGDFATGPSISVKAIKLVHFAALFYGRYAVVAFITLSGFCLMLPLRKLGVNDSFTTMAFIERRLKRIYPPYLVGLALGVVVCAMTGFQGPLTVRGILEHLLLVHNWTDQIFTINGVLWSVALEVQIYLVFALLLLPLYRRFGSAGSLTAACVVAFVLLKTELFGAAMILAFAIGMTSAMIVPARVDVFTRLANSRYAFYIFASSVLFAIAVQDRNSTPWFLDYHSFGLSWVSEILFAYMVAVLMRRMTTSKAESASWLYPERRIFEQRYVVGIGFMSYSIYLVHVPLFGALRLMLPTDSSFEFATTCYYVLWPSVIIGFAYLVYLLAEIPSIKWARSKRGAQS